MIENENGGIVVDCAVKMHMRIGPGLFFSASPSLPARQFFRVELRVTA